MYAAEAAGHHDAVEVPVELVEALPNLGVERRRGDREDVVNDLFHLVYNLFVLGQQCQLYLLGWAAP